MMCASVSSALLIRIIPYTAEEDCFALKGGTAINLFVRDMPRLSVDIDLKYLPVSSREESLTAIDCCHEADRRSDTQGPSRRPGQRLRDNTRKGRNQASHPARRCPGEGRGYARSPRLCLRTQSRTVSPSVEAAFGFAETRVVSFADLYAGKIVAALDRQHPRDLFDVRDLLANEGIDDPLRRAFIVYLPSHNRPMAEILAPKRKPIAEEFRRGFEGMTARPVLLEELTTAREELIAVVVGQLPAAHGRFLLSFKRGEPEWSLLGLPHAGILPAVRWRQQNLGTLTSGERNQLVSQLERVLFPSTAASGSGSI